MGSLISLSTKFRFVLMLLKKSMCDGGGNDGQKLLVRLFTPVLV